MGYIDLYYFIAKDLRVPTFCRQIFIAAPERRARGCDLKDKLMPGSKFALCASLIIACCTQTRAATVPPGVQLAEIQHIVRHIKDEPSSLDPIKGVGLT